MKYPSTDYRGKGKPANVPSVGPVYLEDGFKRVKDKNGKYERVRIVGMYKCNQGLNRHDRRKLDALYREKFGKVAFEKLKTDRKKALKEAAAQ